MKRYILTIVLSLLFTTAYTQEQTLLGNHNNPVGGFGGFHSHLSLDQQGYVSAGGFGGVSFQDYFFGGFGMGTSAFASYTKEGIDYNQSIGVGGFMIGYVFPNDKIIHFFGQVKAGWGGYNLTETDTGREVFMESIFVVLPEVGLELNVTKWFRIAATAGYQLTTGVATNDYVTNKDLMFPMAGLSFRFGRFSGN